MIREPFWRRQSNGKIGQPHVFLVRIKLQKKLYETRVQCITARNTSETLLKQYIPIFLRHSVANISTEIVLPLFIILWESISISNFNGDFMLLWVFIYSVLWDGEFWEFISNILVDAGNLLTHVATWSLQPVGTFSIQINLTSYNMYGAVLSIVF